MSNLADAIMASIDNPAAKGVTFEACGYDNRHEKTVLVLFRLLPDTEADIKQHILFLQL